MASFHQETTIHGTKYIFNPLEGKLSRLFWTIAFICSFLGFAFYIYIDLLKLFFSPETAFKVSQRPMHEIPFPALTICTPIVSKRKFVNFRNESEILVGLFQNSTNKYSNKECDYIQANEHWCQHPDTVTISTFCTFDQTRHSTMDIIKVMNESSLETHELLDSRPYQKFVMNKNETLSPVNKFDKVITDRGFCYTTNMQGYDVLFNEGLNKDFDSFKRTIVRYMRYDQASGKREEVIFNDTKHWTVEKGYPNNNRETFPARAIQNNVGYLGVILKKSEASNFCFAKEFSIILHLPNEIPTPFHKVYPFEYEKFKKFGISAINLQSDEALRVFSPFKRDCYFEGERKLQFFKSYTKAHCDWECMTNYTLARCGCVKYSMPRNLTTRVCDLNMDVQCYFESMESFPAFSFTENSDKPCDCLSTCHDIKYDAILEYDSALNGQLKKEFFAFSWLITRNFVAEVHLNYVSYKIQNFISDFGGLLGLFMGCSLLSIVELFYFAAAKLRNKKLRQRNRALKVGEFSSYAQSEKFRRLVRAVEKQMKKND